jgi:GNAT superfamily N-acetyltransferase
VISEWKVLIKFPIVENYKNNKDLRKKYYRYTQTVFPGIDFKAWYEQGCWTDNYIPFSIIEEDKIVSNVSVARMDLLVEGAPKKGIQIGAVGTLPEYRNRGLSRYLMEYVIDKYDSSSDIIFLFANETVLEFYPKFNFKPYREAVFKSTAIPKSNFSGRKLDLKSKPDRDIISTYLMQRGALTRKFGATGYDFITQWHLINVFPDNLLYIEDEQVIFIMSEKENQLHVWDVIFKEPIHFESAISKSIQDQNIKSILYYFPPDQLPFEYNDILEDKDSHLFVRGDFEVGEQDFKFPVTAQT